MTRWTGGHEATLLAFEAAAQSFVDLVAQARGDWDRPGLGRWDLRALVGHTARALVTVSSYLDRPAESVVLGSASAYLTGAAKSDAEAVFARGVAAGADLGDDPSAAVAAIAERALERVRAADPEAVVETIGGGMTRDTDSPPC